MHHPTYRVAHTTAFVTSWKGTVHVRKQNVCLPRAIILTTTALEMSAISHINFVPAKENITQTD